MTDHETGGTSTIQLGSFNLSSGINHAANGTSTITVFCNAAFMEGLSTITIEATGTGFIFPYSDCRNTDNISIDEVHFESIYAGHKTSVQQFTIRNDQSSTLNLTLTPKASPNQKGTAIDTYQSTYLSPDGSNYSQSLTLSIAPQSSETFYIYYLPPSTGKIGEKEWEVSHRDESLSGVTLLPLWFQALPITITGDVSDVDDAKILLNILYVSDVMRNDFSDIRFYDVDGVELESEIIYLRDSVECYFRVTIPTLPASPDTVTIYAYAGNPLAPSLDNATCTLYDWVDGTLAPWNAIYNGWPGDVYGPHASVTNGTWNGITTKLLYLPSDWSNYQGIAETDSTQNEGLWSFNFKGYDQSGKLFFYFMKNTATSYAVSVNKTLGNDTATIGLEKNDSVIASDTMPITETGEYEITVLRESSGEINIFLDGVLVLSHVDTDISSSTYMRLRSLPVSANPDVQHYYVYSVETLSTHHTGPITFGTWTWYFILGCKGGILYKSQDLPELEAEISYGCRIGGDYYE